jgi:hypothetical protein
MPKVKKQKPLRRVVPPDAPDYAATPAECERMADVGQRILWKLPLQVVEAGLCHHCDSDDDKKICGEPVGMNRFLCDSHLASHTGLLVGESTIPGTKMNGLFVAPGASFEKGQTIEVYTGHYSKQPPASDQPVDYVLKFNGMYVCADDSRCSMIRYANDNKDEGKHNAAFISLYDTIKSDDADAKRVGLWLPVVKATRDLVAGEEIFIYYGDSRFDLTKK